MSLFLMSGSKSNLYSVDPGVQLTYFEEIVPKGIQTILRDAFPHGNARLWALHSSFEQYYESMGQEDHVLFIASGTGKYELLSRITGKVRSPELSRAMRLLGIWKSVIPHHYQNIIFLGDVRRIAVPKEEINEVLRYKADFTPQGPIWVREPAAFSAIMNLLYRSLRGK